MHIECASNAQSSSDLCAYYAHDKIVRGMHNAIMDSEWFKSQKKAQRVTDAELAEAMGVERSVANKVVNGKVAFDARAADKIADLFSTTRDEVLFRAGVSSSRSQVPPQRPLDMARAPEQMPTHGAYDDQGSVQLRRINLGFAMGDGSNLDDMVEEGTIDFDANLLKMITAAPSHRLVVADGVGDSMHPTIMDSDMILIDTLQTRLNKSDRIWALSLFGAGAVKRLAPAGEGKIEVISDNPIVPNRIVPADEIKLIGRVVWSSRRH